MKKILVPLDGSAQSVLAARWATQRAREAGGSVTLLHVYNMPAEEAMGLANLPREEVVVLKQRHGEASFAPVREFLADDAANVDYQVAIGDPAEEIVSLARHQGYDHIVMGSRGRSLVRELLLGSISEAVLHHAPCAVTIIR
jgi:nucleotide-binding universal stress UspA family protein